MADPPIGGSGGDLSLFRVLLQNISKLSQLQRIGNTLPFGAVLSVTVGTANAQVLAADPAGITPPRTGIIFHNPSQTAIVLVAPALDANGAALAPTIASPAGGFLILPMDYLPFSGNVQGAFTGAASVGSTPLTILTSTF